MKTNLKFIAVAMFILTIIGVQSSCAWAQPNPTMSTKHTAAQIDKMYTEHRTDRPRDILAPQEISGKFNQDFPKARDIEWEQSSILYEVEFEMGRFDYDAYYDYEGNLVMYKAEISEGELPAVVKNTALAKYPNYRFDDVTKIVKGLETSYKMELKKGKTEVKIVLKSDGTIIQEYLD